MSLTPFVGIIIGALVGGMCFVVFGLLRAAHTGGLSIIIVLNKLQGKPIGQSLFVRMMVATGIILSIVLGLAASMVLGGAVGGVIEYILMKLTYN